MLYFPVYMIKKKKKKGGLRQGIQIRSHPRKGKTTGIEKIFIERKKDSGGNQG